MTETTMADAKRTSPADPQALAFFQQELARTAVPSGLAAAGSALWPRFAGYYQGLARLPRRLRRALQRRWRRSLGGIALLCALGQAPALAATINVGGACTLVDAITAANNDALTAGCTAGSGADTIVPPAIYGFSPLTTVNNDTDGPNGLPVITTAITIEGPFRTITRDSSAPPFRIIAVGATGNLTLKNTTVSGGVAIEFWIGGGIRNNGTLTLTNSNVSGNTAQFGGGGGIGNYDGTLTLTNVTVSGNTAGGSGGGIRNNGIRTLTLTNSNISGNTADYGGGIHNDGTLTLTNSNVSGNTARDSGGGIRNDGLDTLTLTNSNVSGNTAGDSGGGISNDGFGTS
jgi:predicted outer membrane repeat protein